MSSNIPRPYFRRHQGLYESVMRQSQNLKMQSRSARYTSRRGEVVEGGPAEISPMKFAKNTERVAPKSRESFSDPATIVADVRRKAAANRQVKKSRQSEAEPAGEEQAPSPPQQPRRKPDVSRRLEENRRQRFRELESLLAAEVASGKISQEYADQQLAHEQFLWQPADGSQFGVDRTSVEQDAREQARQAEQSATENVTGRVMPDVMDQMLTFAEQDTQLRVQTQQQINETSQVDATQARLNAQAEIITPAVVAAGDNNAITEQRSDVPVIDRRSVTANPYAMAFQNVGTVYGTNMANSTVESRVNARMRAVPTDSLWWLKDPLKMKEDSVDAQLARAAVAYQAKNPQFEQKNEQEVERLLSRTPVYRVYASDCSQSVSSVPSMVKLF